MSRVPPDVRLRVALRDGGVCRRCGSEATDVHHRRGRGSGGTKINEHQLSRLVSLCRRCHMWAETNRAEAYATGWAVRRGDSDDCAEIPMVRLDGRLICLTDDGESTLS